uniref:2-C-methyl-D-erythritol 4-phosphate cytidylyltransferase, chloroplastic n=2 Tax=Phaeomonas parva TaxID=124430 RepID=A0A7S1UCG6_9STRA|mmetsp:Transcript_3873/g.11208  ORF Transcript_3873/g.11208 Transcript_3873/m.11208 type:complete len:279 (+) Transcript_3873:95-931(+)|eukprot:CAMPEP_0118876314 /NCGR_PEP_ID=MMETSP1163-20130328/17060_1 /TAXON_ID=124430 /ORGANISM="Phaeomonas parva, Strain CCMP2877" /LENGTH=278 /DNA_ID=CAMNT_0006811917 /DNA_START=130 /DNA_END=966 /DNA_ORIENTATION=+
MGVRVAATLLCVLALAAHGPVSQALRLGSGRRASALRMSAKAPAGAPKDVAVVLLAGGVGSRMKADRPKQFLTLAGKPVLEHTIELFRGIEGVSQIVLVLDEQYRGEWKKFAAADERFVFADPGKERQDSVENGLSKVVDGASLVAVHDAARPLVTPAEIYNVLMDGVEHGAAVLGVPMKATVKESEDGEFVLRTIPRSRLWEIQTPQVIRPALLREGFRKVKELGLEVTDDVSIVEQIGEPVKITVGEYTNIKLTTPEDMQIAESILREREDEKVSA